MSPITECCDPAFPEFAGPQDWSSLIRPPTEQARAAVSDLLSMADDEARQEYIERLTREHLPLLVEFFSACPKIRFFFVAWDHLGVYLLQRAGPTKRKVQSLLKSRGARRSRGNSAQADLFDRVYDAIQTALEELDQRNEISYALLWRFPDDRVPQLQTSLHLSRAGGWKAIRLLLPNDERDKVPASPPPTEQELDRVAIRPAAPTVSEPDPGTCPISWPEYQRRNPLCPRDWRWNRAHSLVRHGRYFSQKRDDDVTAEAVRFLRDLLRKPQDTMAVVQHHPHLVEAHAIYAGNDGMRQELEARLLARQTPQEVAERLSLAPEAVEAYIDTFFDVRDRLDAGMYIHKQVLQPAWRRNVADGLLMSLAYHGGPAVLEAVLPLLRNKGRELERLTSGGGIQSTLAERLMLLLQVHHLPSDEKTQKDLIRRFYDLLATFPRFEPQVDVIGAFSQIVEPFEGTLSATSTAEPETEVAFSRAA